MTRVTLPKLPVNLTEFQALAENQLTRPEMVCALFLCALQLYLQNQNEGIAALNMLRGPRPMLPYDQQFLRDRLRGKTYLPLAYFQGARPENGYTPQLPYTLDVLPVSRPQDIEPGYLRFFLTTAGADRPRPIRLRHKPSTGEWFLWEYSSILTGIRIPAAEDPWS